MTRNFTVFSCLFCLIIAALLAIAPQQPAAVSYSSFPAIPVQAADRAIAGHKPVLPPVWPGQMASNTTAVLAGSGIMELPAMPSSQAYVQTAASETEIANAAVNISMIEPPKPHFSGNALVAFNLRLPEGRRGMQPVITFQYNNEAGPSWQGMGWFTPLPCVYLETRWGAPRFNDTLETEMYLLSGEQLAPVNNRSALIKRTTDKVFYQRVGGAFQQIIRHGSKPDNYWWEVNSPDGVRNYYGGTPARDVLDSAVLKDDLGNIAYWGLTETWDADSNSVKYKYATVHDAGLVGGSVDGRQLYISEITYTGNRDTEGPYKVTFVRDRMLGEPLRKDIIIDGRMGLKIVNADLLREVRISYNDTLIRKYTCAYSTGAFYKTVLDSISEADAAGDVFYTHRFAYYDDARRQGIYEPSAGTTAWEIGSDGLTGYIENSLPGFGTNATALSTSRSWGGSQSTGVTVGTIADLWSKNMSVGGFGTYGEDNDEGVSQLIDINGDGLPDKVFKDGTGGLYYRANLGVAVKKFGDRRPITGVGTFSKGKTISYGGGVQVVPFMAFLGFCYTTSNATTTAYFSDFNGDGLMDIADNGQVYFNHLNSQGDPEFTTSSTPTPCPILGGSGIKRSSFTKDTALQRAQEQKFPLQDVVRFWTAPFSDTISISAPLQLVDVPSSGGVINKRKDGVRASIQLRDIVLWSDTIAPNDFTQKVPVNVSGLRVNKGDRIYFRLQSRYNGEDDLVQWDPVITYTHPVIPGSDVQHKSSDLYQASADFILHGTGSIGMVKDGVINVDGAFTKAPTSDTVTVVVDRIRNNVVTTLFAQTFGGRDTADIHVQLTGVSVLKDDQLHFRLACHSYIDRSAMLWKPHYAYTSFTDGTPAISDKGNPVMQAYLVPDNTNYNDWKYAAPPVLATQQDTVKIWPLISAANGAGGNVWFTVKGIDTIYARRKLTLVNGSIDPAVDTIRLVRSINAPMYMEFAVDSQDLAINISAAAVAIYKDSVYLNGTDPDTVAVSQVLPANLYVNPDLTYMGSLFRGWGCFALKGDKGNGPIDVSMLNLNELMSYPNNPGDYNDSASISTLNDPTQTNFLILFPDAEKQSYRSYDTSVFVTAGHLSSARLYMHNVAVDSLQQGESATAVNKTSETKTNSFATGAMIMPVEAGYGMANYKTISETDMLDVNGDRFPDVVDDESIQYTLPAGGLGDERKTHPISTTTNTGSSEGFNAGGEFQSPVGANTTQKGAVGAEKGAKAAPGGSYGQGSSKDQSATGWVDINGDGLMDRVYSNGSAALSLGYRFTAIEPWGFLGVDKSSAGIESGGASFSIFGGSFEGGTSYARVKGETEQQLNDVTGDGIPDQLSVENGVVMVRINKGNGFGDPVPWNDFNAITVNNSTGQSFNAGATGVFSIPIFFFKICFNPSGEGLVGVSRQQHTVMDIDGDGYADMLHSENDGQLSASRSTFDRSNMLKSVTGPLGSYFAIDYDIVGNTYDVPMPKWVMKSLAVADGLSGDGPDTIRSRFTYEGGYLDRQEREFLGFKKVVTHKPDAEHNNIVYKREVQQYLNHTFYSKGLLTHDWVEDADGHKYSEIRNEYDSVHLYEYVEYAPLHRSTRFFYNGNTTAGASAAAEYQYDTWGNVTRIAEGNTADQQDIRITQIAYHQVAGRYLKSVVKREEVSSAAGVLRLRTTEANAKGDIVAVHRWLADGSEAETRLEYDDTYGMVSKVTLPANAHGQRMFYQFEYDPAVHMYPVKTKDAWGNVSTAAYNYRFGVLTGRVNRNNEAEQYEYDNRGRMISYTGPYELAAGKPYSVKFDYNTNAHVAYASMRRYDPEHDADVLAYKFVDGWGQPVQEKRQVAVFKGKGMADDIKLVVSGKASYDALGRLVKVFDPVTEPIGPLNLAYNTKEGNLQSVNKYDVADRPVETTLADGAVTATAYTIDHGMFSSIVTDALGNRKEVLKDTRGRIRQTRAYGPDGVIATRFEYNGMGELVRSVDGQGHVLTTTYDNLGRKVKVEHPDGGATQFEYDLSGNLLKKITPQVRKEIPDNGAIQYDYDLNRLVSIDYPRQYQNKVTYTYGAAGTGHKAGRLLLQVDASGGQEFFYGLQGTVVKHIRTVQVNPVFATTYVSEQAYDSWGRIKKMVYPDGEAVEYHYNKAGKVTGMDGSKHGSTYKYVQQLGYDEWGEKVYMQYGNGAETKYAYDDQRHRLQTLKASTASGHLFENNLYTYDVVNNVRSAENNVQAQTGKVGGYTKQTYQYDQLNRLVAASGTYRGAQKEAGYQATAAYDNQNNLVRKTFSGTGDNSYDLTYTYSGAAPHLATQAGSDQLDYDANGNLTGYSDKENFYDEENRLLGVLNKGVLSQFTYDADNRRVIKSSGGVQALWLNGAPAGTVKHNDNYTVYVSGYLVCTSSGFTKHYYMGDERVASKQGHGTFTNITFPQPGLTAGGIDYGARAAALERARLEYYASLGVSPGPPTDKWYYARPENSGIAAPVIVDTSAALVPRGWPGNTTPPPNGPPIFVAPIPANDSVKAGYGFQDPGHLYEVSQFFYHAGMDGSVLFVSNGLGEVSEQLDYVPSGEKYMHERSATWASAFFFNGQMQDEETGYYNYEDRYYDPVLSQRLLVADAMGSNMTASMASNDELSTTTTMVVGDAAYWWGINANVSVVRMPGMTSPGGSYINEEVHLLEEKVLPPVELSPMEERQENLVRRLYGSQSEDIEVSVVSSISESDDVEISIIEDPESDATGPQEQRRRRNSLSEVSRVSLSRQRTRSQSGSMDSRLRTRTRSLSVAIAANSNQLHVKVGGRRASRITRAQTQIGKNIRPATRRNTR